MLLANIVILLFSFASGNGSSAYHKASKGDISVATSIFYAMYALLNGANSHVRAIPNDQLIGVVSFYGGFTKVAMFSKHRCS